MPSNMDATEDAEGIQVNQDKIKLEEAEEEQVEASPTMSDQAPRLLDIKIRIHESYNNYFNY